MFTPAVFVGTMIIENALYGDSSVLPVLHITIRMSLTDAFDENHLCPLITHSSPSRTASVFRRVGSAPAFGSVMLKQLRILPSSKGVIHVSICSSVPPTDSSSAL